MLDTYLERSNIFILLDLKLLGNKFKLFRILDQKNTQIILCLFNWYISWIFFYQFNFNEVFQNIKNTLQRTHLLQRYLSNIVNDIFVILWIFLHYYGYYLFNITDCIYLLLWWYLFNIIDDIYLTLYEPNSFFRCFSGHNLR